MHGCRDHPLTRRPRPEPHTEYSLAPNDEFRAASSAEACRALARSWDVTVTRAARLLTHPDEYAAECRARSDPASAEWYERHEAELVQLARETMTGPEARRSVERRYRAPQ